MNTFSSGFLAYRWCRFKLPPPIPLTGRESQHRSASRHLPFNHSHLLCCTATLHSDSLAQSAITSPFCCATSSWPSPTFVSSPRAILQPKLLSHGSSCVATSILSCSAPAGAATTFAASLGCRNIPHHHRHPQSISRLISLTSTSFVTDPMSLSI